jgi:glutaminase
MAKSKAECTVFQQCISEAIALAEKNNEGSVASYIPELAALDDSLTGVSIKTTEGDIYTGGNIGDAVFTLQSVAKLIVLIGLLEDIGADKVFSCIKMEPSGDDFASLARLDQFGPRPSNPMLNAGAIALCSYLSGNIEDQLHWLDEWAEKLFGSKLNTNVKVCASERRTGDRNRSLTYLMLSTGVIQGDADKILEPYFHLCSLEANIAQAAHLPMLLANLGKNEQGEQIISKKTAQTATSIMATCGLYNESGAHLVKTGMPAKSAVSGLIVAVAPKKAGIAVYSPKVNKKGTSVRAEIVLEFIAQTLDWHFLN